MMEKILTDTGSKARQRADSEWRAKPYSDWHRTLARGLMMFDVDSIEWRFKGGKLVSVGVMEITRIDNGSTVSDNYLAAILQRFKQRDIQGRVAFLVAEALKTKAYIVLFQEDCSQFWVYNLTDSIGWMNYCPSEMEGFLEAL
jgi:hypothetical protein